MTFDFHRKLVNEEGEVDEAAASRYVEEVAQRFAESPEGAALAARGVEPGGRLGMFLDYALRYVGVSPAELDAPEIRETRDVFAEKVTGRPEDLDLLIPELEAFCDFVQRAFGLARGHDLNTKQDVNEWMRTVQMEQLARATMPGGGILGTIGERLLDLLGAPPAGAALGDDVAKQPLIIGDLTDPALDDFGEADQDAGWLRERRAVRRDPRRGARVSARGRYLRGENAPRADSRRRLRPRDRQAERVVPAGHAPPGQGIEPGQWWRRADLLRARPTGGAVFAPGSITYVAALLVDDRVSRITANVLGRFLAD
ncbi:MAG: hypothetical protein ACRDIY_03775 [Chloroflexota bacterium]